MTEDLLTETDSTALIAVGDTAGIAVWSENKKNQFVATFQKRTLAARYILVRTAEILFDVATRRRFLSSKHRGSLPKTAPPAHNCRDVVEGELAYQRFKTTAGGRETSELDVIAMARAEALLKSLPPLKSAVQIIDPETAKKIDRRDALLVKGQALLAQIEPLKGTIRLSDYDDLTVREFRAMVREREKKRAELVSKLDDIGLEGCELEDGINKALYDGLPGLSEAVLEIILDHYEQALALVATTRRMEEQILYGDSENAMEILRHFEKDEVQVSSSVKQKFDNALEKLKLSALKKKKTK